MEPIRRPADSVGLTRVARVRRSGGRPGDGSEGSEAPAQDRVPTSDHDAQHAPPRRRVRAPIPEGGTAGNDTPTLADHWSVLRRRRRIVAAFVVLAVVVAGAWVWRTGPDYKAESSVVIRPIVSDAFAETRIEDVGAPTEAAIVGSTVVARIAARRLGLAPEDAESLRRHVHVVNPVGTLVLRITFSSGSRRRAQAGAQAFAEAYLEHRRASADRIRARGIARNGARLVQLERQLAGAIAAVNAAPIGSEERAAAEGNRDDILGRITAVNSASASLERVDTDPGQIIRPADRPRAPSGPSPLIVLVAAGFLGLVVGTAFAFLRDRTDPRISSRRSWSAITGIDPIAVVPLIPSSNPMPALTDPEGRAASALRRLRVAIWPQRGDGPRRIVVTSPTSSAAADAVAGNLALTLALAGWSTLLAWATSGTSDGVGDGGHGGLEGYAVAPAPEPVPGAMGVERLSLLSLPADPSRPGTLAERLAARLSALGGAYDVEIIAAPALLRAADAFEVSPLSDAMLVVVDVSEERREDLDASVDALDAIDAPLEGVVAYAVPKGW